MQPADYEILKKQLPPKNSENLLAGFIVLSMTSLTFLMLFLSFTQSGFIWFLAQTILGVLILQWFFLVHEMGHGHFFSHPKLNVIFGHLASFFVMLPFFSWRYIHRHHHLWTGWKDKDPTMSIIIPSEVPSWQKFIINFCWKYWIPIFSFSFSLSNFWNIPKLRKLFPEKKGPLFFSLMFVCLTHAGVIYAIGWGNYLHSWGLAYLTFFFISDPLLISQHAGIPQHHSHGSAVGQLHFKEQDEFTRSLAFPNWIQTYIFFGFNRHSLHHLFPTLPGYQLSRIKHKSKNEIHWYQWLKSAKSTPAMELFFTEELEHKKTVL